MYPLHEAAFFRGLPIECTLRCMRTRAAEWAERLAAWRDSGLSAEAFAKAGGYRPKTLQWWASEFRRRASPAKTRQPRAEATMPMARVLRRPAPSAVGVDEALAIRVDGAVIAVRRGFDPQLLREIIAALGSGR